MGHHISECGKLHYKNRPNVTESETSDTLFLSCQVSQQILDKNVWLLDGGCNNHMNGHNDLLSNFDASLITTISLGDDHSIKASRKGVVPFLTKQGEVKNIPDVYYVPNIKHNLLSVGKLMAHGYDVNFHNNICTILNQNKRLVAKIPMTKNRLFPLEMISGKIYACNILNVTETKLWHYRYDHLPVKSMSLLQRQSMVKGLPPSIN